MRITKGGRWEHSSPVGENGNDTATMEDSMDIP